MRADHRARHTLPARRRAAVPWPLDHAQRRRSGVRGATERDRAAVATHGRFVEGAARLLDHTDALCASTLANAESSTTGLADHLFAATDVFQGRDGLPASTLVHAATEHRFSSADRARPAEVAADLLRRRGDPGLGALYVAGHLLHDPVAPPIVANVIVKCLASGRYHLRLLGLQLAEDSAHGLEETARRVVLEAVRSLPNNNLMLNTSIVEALSALGDLT